MCCRPLVKHPTLPLVAAAVHSRQVGFPGDIAYLLVFLTVPKPCCNFLQLAYFQYPSSEISLAFEEPVFNFPCACARVVRLYFRQVSPRGNFSLLSDTGIPTFHDTTPTRSRRSTLFSSFSRVLGSFE